MKTHGFYFYNFLLICTLQTFVTGKTLFEKQNDLEAITSQKNSDSTIQYRASAQNGREAEEEEDAQGQSQATFKVPKINTQGTQCYDVPSSKRSTDDVDRFKKRRSPFGVVYSQGKPIGILEPISRMYEFQTLQNREGDDQYAIKTQFKRNIQEKAEERIKYSPVLNTKLNNKLKMKHLDEDEPTYNQKKRENTIFKREEDSGKRVEAKKEAKRSADVKIKTKIKSNSETKRSAVDKSTKSPIAKAKRELGDKNLEAIEDNLKAIMDDLGLIDGDKVGKREVQEDEDLESGLNKIGLTKEQHSVERNKKENGPAKTNMGEAALHSKQLRKGTEMPNGEESTIVESDPFLKNMKKTKIADYRSEEEKVNKRKKREENRVFKIEEEKLEKNNDLKREAKKDSKREDKKESKREDIKNLKRENNKVSKREDKIDSQREDKTDLKQEEEKYLNRKKREQAKPENNDIVKGLETSGDLTVSGNKSPLASSSASLETESKHKTPVKEEKRDHQAVAGEDDEKRLQRNIQNKITEIKEEVKREISAIKVQKPVNAASEKKRNAEMKSKPGSKEGMKKARSKRNLLDKETKNLEPQSNLAQSDLKAHVRLRRDAANDETEDVVQNDDKNSNRVTWREIHDEDKEVADLNKRDGLEPLKKYRHDPKNYEFSYRNKRKEEEEKREEEEGDALGEDQIDVAKRNLDSNSELSGKRTEGNLGFRDAQNLNVARVAHNPATRALVTRGLQDRNAPVVPNNFGEAKKRTDFLGHDTLDAEKLERLVSESDSLMESFKNERGARSGEATPRIEVELHSGSKDNSKSFDGESAPNKREKFQENASMRKADDDLVENHSEAARLDEFDDKVQVVRIERNAKSKILQKITPNDKSKLSPENVSLQDTSNVVEDPAFSKAAESKIKIKDDATKLVDLKVADPTNRDDVANVAVENVKDFAKIAEDAKEKAPEQVVDIKKRAIVEKEQKHEEAKISDKEKKDAKSESKSAEKTKFLDATSGENDANLALTNDKNNVIRQERKSEPNLSLEEMQTMDSENNAKRKRRYVDDYYRSKRDEPNNMQIKTYRSDEDEADDESDEFDDDNFDDRTANLVRKRAATRDANYNEFDEDYEPADTRINKRNLHAKNYVNHLNSDAFETPNYLYANPRNKRQVIGDVASLHSGGPMMRHLAAVRERNLQPLDSNYRRKRLEKLNQKQSKDQTIAGLAESDIFGGFPQSYEGELSRFKRVKRDSNLVKSN